MVNLSNELRLRYCCLFRWVLAFEVLQTNENPYIDPFDNFWNSGSENVTSHAFSHSGMMRHTADRCLRDDKRPCIDGRSKDAKCIAVVCARQSVLKSTKLVALNLA